MNIWRVTGVALLVGLTLFLVTLLVKLVLIALVTGLLIRVVGGRLAGRFFTQRGRVGWSSADIISIDNPTYHAPMNRVNLGRIIPIS